LHKPAPAPEPAPWPRLAPSAAPAAVAARRADLPPHWYAIDDGGPPFFNELTGERQAERPTALPLPPPWQRLAAADGTVYYANSLTKATSWIPPDPTAYVRALVAALPPGWRMLFTADDATPYYVSSSGVRSWRHPAESALVYYKVL